MKWVRKLQTYFTPKARALRAANQPTRLNRLSFRKPCRKPGGMLPSAPVALAIYQAARRRMGVV